MKIKMGVRNSMRDETATREMPSRAFGLGADPSGGASAWSQACGCPLTQVPVLEYVTLTAPLPITDTALEATFGTTIQVLNQQGTPQGVSQVDSSFAINGLLQANMFVIGIGVHAFAEPFSFSIIGNTISSAATSLPISPDTFTLSDQTNGGLGTSFTAVGSILPGTLEWGFADWLAVYHMNNAYQFQWKFCQRYLLLNELMADVCFYGPYADGQGFGDSDVSVQQFVAQANEFYSGINAGTYFLPVSHRRIGSISVTPATSGPTLSGVTPVFHPTRDFDLAGAAFGGLKNQGHSGAQPFRKMTKPIFLPTGQPISMTLYQQDTYHWEQMQRYMSVSEGAGTNKTAVTSVASPALTGYQSASSLGTKAGLELTYDQGGNYAYQQLVNTDRTTTKGGVLKIAMLLKGFEVGGAWLGAMKANAGQMASQVYMPAAS